MLNRINHIARPVFRRDSFRPSEPLANFITRESCLRRGLYTCTANAHNLEINGITFSS